MFADFSCHVAIANRSYKYCVLRIVFAICVIAYVVVLHMECANVMCAQSAWSRLLFATSMYVGFTGNFRVAVLICDVCVCEFRCLFASCFYAVRVLRNLGSLGDPGELGPGARDLGRELG